MRPGLVMLLWAVPASAGAQGAPAQPVTEVALVSQPGARPTRQGRFALSASVGVGGFRSGYSGSLGSVDVSGAVAVASLRASLWLNGWLAVQLGGAGGLAVDPGTSSSFAGGIDRGGVATFGLLGGGVLIGARGEGLRVSVLGGVAWSWALFANAAATRGSPSPGGGAVVEVSHHWTLGAGWTLGLGAMAWGLAGSDADNWLGAAGSPNESTSWNNLGGALTATVATR